MSRTLTVHPRPARKPDRLGQPNPPMMEVYLHGFGSDAAEFRSHWPPAQGGESRRFLNGPEFDRLTRRRRWFPLSGLAQSVAKGLATATTFAEASIGELNRREGRTSDAELTLLGHSQGGSVALAVAANRRLNVRIVRAFASALPSGYAVPRTGRVAMATNQGRPVEVELYYSMADRFVEPRDVELTARILRHECGARVVLYRSRTLAHEFSSAWRDPANFLDPVEVT